MKQILIVDDNDGVRTSLTRMLRSKPYRLEVATSGREAIEMTAKQKYDVILLDLVMPDFDGIEVLMEMKKIRPAAKVIIMTGFASIHNAVDAIKKGASDYIEKPIDAEELDVMIRRCIEESQFQQTIKHMDLDFTLSSLSNPLRRKILKLLKENRGMHLMHMARELAIEDHTKVVFHLKILKGSDIITQDEKKGYFLTLAGEKTLSCLRILENHLTLQ